MSHMPYFLRFAKNNLHLELGAGCLYSPRIRVVGKFPETRFPPNIILGNSGTREHTRGHKKDRGLRLPALSLSCCALLADEPADQEAAAYQESARAEREQRRRAATARRRQCLLLLLLRSRSRGSLRSGSRGSLRRRGRSGLRRRGRRRRLTRGLGDHATGFGYYVAVLTLGLSGGTASLCLLGLSVGHHGRLVLGQGG